MKKLCFNFSKVLVRECSLFCGFDRYGWLLFHLITFTFLCFRLHLDCSFLTCPAAVDDQQAEAKAEQAPPPSKKESPIVAETKAQDGTAPNPPSGKKKNSAKKQKAEPGTAGLVIQSSRSFLMLKSI